MATAKLKYGEIQTSILQFFARSIVYLYQKAACLAGETRDGETQLAPCLSQLPFDLLRIEIHLEMPNTQSERK